MGGGSPDDCSFLFAFLFGFAASRRIPLVFWGEEIVLFGAVRTASLDPRFISTQSEYSAQSKPPKKPHPEKRKKRVVRLC